MRAELELGRRIYLRVEHLALELPLGGGLLRLPRGLGGGLPRHGLLDIHAVVGVEPPHRVHGLHHVQVPPRVLDVGGVPPLAEVGGPPDVDPGLLRLLDLQPPLLLRLELGEERAEARAPAVHPLYPPVSLELELKVRNVKFSIFLSEGRGKTENKHH